MLRFLQHNTRWAQGGKTLLFRPAQLIIGLYETINYYKMK